MKLANYKPWMPAGGEQYLTLFPPKTVDGFLAHQAQMLKNLMAEASEKEVEAAARYLKDNLPTNLATSLPEPDAPEFPTALFSARNADQGGTLADWINGIPTALKQKAAKPAESQSELSSLTLESFLGQRV